MTEKKSTFAEIIIPVLEQRVNPDIIKVIEKPKNNRDVLIISTIKYILEQSMEHSPDNDIVIPHHIIDELCTSILQVDMSLKQIYKQK